ncbi:kinase-like domain-containing protein [Suillus ampliporus]|nr:kinase-like domain-containing protein [Suillus ampliporus]
MIRLSCIPDLTDQITGHSLVAEGNFADIFKSRWNSPSDSSSVAVKVIRVQHDLRNLTVDLRREIKVWGRLQDHHILPLLGLVHGYGPLPALVSPWMDNGNLISFLRGRHNTLRRRERLRLLQDIASALQYLHAIAVVHGDLTGSNILVDSHGRAFVTDVGISMMLDDIAESEPSRQGAIRWTAPELANGTENRLPTSKSDVWSFGCNMIHVLSGQEPWSAIRADTRILARLYHQHVPPFPQDISEQDSYFLQQCFSPRPADRPSADQILAFVREESGVPRTVEVTAHSSRGIPDVMAEFKRRVSDQVPSHLIYIPEMKLISRNELAAILKPEMITEEDISEHEGWSRQFVIESKLIPNLLKYATLSHRWGELELTFQDAKSGKWEGAGYEKLDEFCKKAQEHGCLLAWSDTCCINKESSSELDEAIRSMYRCHWRRWEATEWFLRVWTLQELLAPLRMKFYGDGWAPLTENENDKDDAALHDESHMEKEIEHSKDSWQELIQNCKEWQILVWAGGLPGCPTDPACYCATDEAALEMLKNRQISWWGEGCGDSDFSVTKRGVQVRLLMVPASVEQSLEESTFLCRPAGRLSASPLEKLVVRSHFFPPASTTEWAFGIVNYHDHSNADQGRLKRGQHYICFLFIRSRRPGVDTVRNYWKREVTEEIMVVSCVNDLEQILETVWL